MSAHRPVGTRAAVVQPALYADGETPRHHDFVIVDILDRGRIGTVSDISGDRVFVLYEDYAQPAGHWCAVDRCELLRRG